MTPGPFIIYPKDGSKDPYYNTHEPGHVIQFLILGPVNYYKFIAIPSLITSTTPYHSDMPWEKSANQLWYWLTGEYDPRNPLYFSAQRRKNDMRKLLLPIMLIAFFGCDINNEKLIIINKTAEPVYYSLLADTVLNTELPLYKALPGDTVYPNFVMGGKGAWEYANLIRDLR